MKPAVFAALLLLATAPRPADVAREAVSWTNGDVKLAGTLYLPAASGRSPAAIFIHGSGNMGRGPDRGNEILRVHAERLAAAGTAMLLYDKRGVGESTGSWQNASFETLAGDAAGGLELLRRHPRIDPSRVGIFGLSQGAWISLIAGTRAPAVSFIVWVTGPAVSPARQEEHVVATRLRGAGLDASVTPALALLKETLAVYRTDAGWTDLERHANDARETAWFKAARIGVAERSDAWWRWYASFMDYDPRPALEAMRVPLFAAFAAEDELVDSAESDAVLRAVASAGGRVVTATYPGIGHGFRDRSRSLKVPGQYWTDLDRWLATVRP